jgi:hypothetical protein
VDSREGVFRNVALSDAEMEERLWMAMLRATHDLSPSRADRRKHGKSNTKCGRAQHSSEDPVEETVHGESDPEMVDTDEQERELVVEGSPRVTLKPKIDDPLTPMTQESSTSESTIPSAQSSPAKRCLTIPEILDPLSDESDEEDPPMSAFERMKSERNRTNPFDLDTQYGKYMTIYNAVKLFAEPQEIQRLFNKPLDHAALDDATLNAESKKWYNEVEENAKSDKFVIKPATEDELSLFSEMERYLDNPKLQRMDYHEARKALRIDDPQRPQLLGMATSMQFKSWQVPGIKALVDFEADPAIRACILADATGLGKTIQILGYWHYVSKSNWGRLTQNANRLQRLSNRMREMKKYKRQLKAYEDACAAQAEWEKDEDYIAGDTPDLDIPAEPALLSPAKPLLLVALPEIIDQWVEEIRRFSSVFKPIIYYGDKRAPITSAIPKIDGLLQKDSEYFGGDEQNGRIVIITSLPTLAARHGPGSLRTHRINRAGWTVYAANTAYHQSESSWPGISVAVSTSSQ